MAITPRRDDTTVDDAGGRRSDEDARRHAGSGRVERRRGVVTCTCWSGAGRVGDDADGRRRCPVLEQDLSGGVELPRPALRTRVCRGRPRSRRPPPRGDAGFDRLPRREEVGQADEGVVVAERGAEQRRSGQRRGHARHDVDIGVGVCGPARARGRPWRTRRRRRNRRGPRAGRRRRGRGRARHRTDSAPIGVRTTSWERHEQVGAWVEVGPVADDDLARAAPRAAAGVRGAAPGPEADDAQVSRGPDAAGDGHRGVGARLLGHDQSAPGPADEECGGLGHAGRAHGAGDDRARVGHVDGAERGCGKGPQRQPEGHDARLVGLAVDGRDWQRLRREPGGVEGDVERSGHGDRGRAGGGTDAGHERGRVQHDDAGTGGGGRSVTTMPPGPSPATSPAGSGQPRSWSTTRRPPVEQGRRHGGDVAFGDEAGQRVERDRAGGCRSRW